MNVVIEITAPNQALGHAETLKRQIESKSNFIDSIEIVIKKQKEGEMGISFIATLFVILKVAKEPLVELIKQIGQYVNRHPTTSIKLTIEGKGTVEISSNSKNNSAEELAQKLLESLNSNQLSESND